MIKAICTKIFLGFLFGIFLILINSSCKQDESIESPSDIDSLKIIKEHSVLTIPLEEKFEEGWLEFSGMAWYKDYLVLLPQYPYHKNTNGYGYLYTVSKNSIESFLNGESDNPISPIKIEFIAKGLERFNDRGSGYESIIFRGNEVYLTIESLGEDRTAAYIVKGKVENNLSRIILDSNSVRLIDPQTNIFNIGDESILIYNDKVITLHEAYGKNINLNPSTNIFDLSLNEKDDISFPSIEYRITDATSCDSLGRFWAINYFWPGDEFNLKPAPDSIRLNFGIGYTHSEYTVVERLIELQINDSSIVKTNKEPVYLELDDEDGRNWEGIVKLNNKGFVIITDKFPATILAFVPL